MKRRLVMMAICIGSTACPVNGQGLQNGDFEQPGVQGATPEHWVVTEGTFICDGVKKKTGGFSGKLDGVSKPSGVYQDVQVTPGKSYVLGGVWRNGDKTAAFDVARASVRWLTSVGGTPIGDGGQIDSGDVVSEWTPFKLGPLKAPQGAQAARIRLAATFNQAAYDSVTWEEVSSGNGEPATGASATAPAQASANGQSGSEGREALPMLQGRAVGSAGPEPVQPAGQLNWVTNLQEGYRSAQEQNKHVLLFFRGGDPRTQYFEETVFTDPEVQSALAGRWVLVRLDYNSHEEIARKLQIREPGTVVLYDDKGQPLAALSEQIAVGAFEKLVKK